MVFHWCLYNKLNKNITQDEVHVIIVSIFGALWSNVKAHYMTFVLGTALLNFGTRANNIGHRPLDFCRAKANFSAHVPKNLGRPRPPQQVVPARLRRGPRLLKSCTSSN